MPKHNSYFEGNVQSLGYERHGRRATVGVIEPGSYRFDTGGAERMTVISGELVVQIAGSETRRYPAGTAFEIAAKSYFEVKVEAPSAYLCEFI